MAKEAKKKSKDHVLSQDEIDKLLEVITDGEEEFKPVERTRKIKIYDFRRPEKLSKKEIRNISRKAEKIAIKLLQFFKNDCDFDCKRVHLDSVDQITREEYIRSLPTPAFSILFSWFGYSCTLQLDPALVLGGIIRQDIKKYKNISIFDEKIFCDLIQDSLMRIIYKELSNDVKDIPAFENVQFTKDLFMHDFSPNDMGVHITFQTILNGVEGTMNLFLDAEIFNELNKLELFTKENSNIMFLEKPDPNTEVILGRCHIKDNVQLASGNILELNTPYSTPLTLERNGTPIAKGEVCIIDENYALRVTELAKEPTDEEKFYLDFYNTKVVLASKNIFSESELKDLGYGTILEMNQYENDPVKVYKDGKLIALGEATVLDEEDMFAVKIRELL